MASRRLLGKVTCWRRARCHPVRELRGSSGRPGSEWGRANNVPVLIKGSTLPFRAIAGCRHHIPKQRQRATNPAAPDATLRWRGSLTVNLAEVGLLGKSGQVRGRDDGARLPQLRRISVPGRGNQRCGLAGAQQVPPADHARKQGGAAVPLAATVAPGRGAAQEAARPIILVHGAWHGAWCYQRVVPILTAAGHRIYAPTLTGLGERSHLLSKSVNLETQWMGTSIFSCRPFPSFKVSGKMEIASPAVIVSGVSRSRPSHWWRPSSPGASG